jgi:hypothetical protein
VGCTIRYPFEFSGTVTNANGKPVDGVKIHLLNEDLHNRSLTDPEYDISELDHDAKTTRQGKFAFVQEIDVQQFGDDNTTIQYLVFSKKGFQTKHVKLVLKKVKKETVPVKVDVELSPVSKTKRR